MTFRLVCLLSLPMNSPASIILYTKQDDTPVCIQVLGNINTEASETPVTTRTVASPTSCDEIACLVGATSHSRHEVIERQVLLGQAVLTAEAISCVHGDSVGLRAPLGAASLAAIVGFTTCH